MIVVSYALVVILLLLAAPDRLAAQAEGCSHCGTRAPEVSQLIQEADRLHGEFNPTAAAVELQKAIKLEPACA